MCCMGEQASHDGECVDPGTHIGPPSEARCRAFGAKSALTVAPPGGLVNPLLDGESMRALLTPSWAARVSFGVKVATTVGKGVVDTNIVDQRLIVRGAGRSDCVEHRDLSPARRTPRGAASQKSRTSLSILSNSHS